MLTESNSHPSKKINPIKALHLLFITILVASTLGMAPIQPTQAESIFPAESVSPEGLLNPDGTLDLSSGFQGTLDLRGWQVTRQPARTGVDCCPPIGCQLAAILAGIPQARFERQRQCDSRERR